MVSKDTVIAHCGSSKRPMAGDVLPRLFVCAKYLDLQMLWWFPVIVGIVFIK